MANKSRVVMVRSQKVLNPGGAVDAEVLSAMVRSALLSLTGTAAPEKAWGSLFSPGDTVGIKVNAIAGRLLSPSPAWVSVLARGLRTAGVEEKRIVLWDRSSRELKEAGFPLNWEGKGMRCFGTDAPGMGYDPDLVENGSIGGLLSRVLTTLTSAQVNLCILKDHNLAGLSGALKNLYGAIHNPNKYHDGHCNPYIADLNALPQIRQKFRLTLCDALRVQCHGGPAFKSQWMENYRGILASFDPVALDFVGWRLLDQIRKAHGLSSLQEEDRAPLYILTAGDATHRLGKCKESDIELVQLSV
jgi:uncharacterized protein (DUF362 family)